MGDAFNSCSAIERSGCSCSSFSFGDFASELNAEYMLPQCAEYPYVDVPEVGDLFFVERSSALGTFHRVLKEA